MQSAEAPMERACSAGEILERLLESVKEDGDLASSGCFFVEAPIKMARPREWRIYTNYECKEKDNVAELFLGQLPFDYSPGAVLGALCKVLNFSDEIVVRLKYGSPGSCAFIELRKGYEERLLEYNGRILFDSNGMWVAPLTNARALEAMLSECKRRKDMAIRGLPKKPLVIETISENKPVSRPAKPPPEYNSFWASYGPVYYVYTYRVY